MTNNNLVLSKNMLFHFLAEEGMIPYNFASRKPGELIDGGIVLIGEYHLSEGNGHVVKRGYLQHHAPRASIGDMGCLKPEPAVIIKGSTSKYHIFEDGMLERISRVEKPIKIEPINLKDAFCPPRDRPELFNDLVARRLRQDL